MQVLLATKTGTKNPKTKLLCNEKKKKIRISFFFFFVCPNTVESFPKNKKKKEH